jgi:hypothetical protein
MARKEYRFHGSEDCEKGGGLITPKKPVISCRSYILLKIKQKYLSKTERKMFKFSIRVARNNHLEIFTHPGSHPTGVFIWLIVAEFMA